MELDKKEADLLDNMLRYWQSGQLIDEEQALKLKSSYSRRITPAGIWASYAFIAAVSCGMLAFGALVLDEKWVELFRKRLGLSEAIVGIFFILITFLLTYLAKIRLRKSPEYKVANETFTLTIVMSLAVGLAYLGRSFGYFDNQYAPVLLVAACCYGGIALYLNTQLLWVTMLCTLAGWWGAQTYSWSQGADYFLGMNYALRMTVFGLFILAMSYVLQRKNNLLKFHKSTYFLGWVFFLIAAWTLSIFGNKGSMEAWMAIRQGQLWYWALGYTFLLAGLLYYAFRQKEDTLRDIVLIFCLLHIYTRYFEYFWDSTNKGIFFSLLALSFWWLGKKAEQWRRKTG